MSIDPHPAACRICGAPAARRQGVYCELHREVGRRNHAEACAAANRARMAEWRATGADPTHGGPAAAKRGEKIAAANAKRSLPPALPGEPTPHRRELPASVEREEA